MKPIKRAASSVLLCVALLAGCGKPVSSAVSSAASVSEQSAAESSYNESSAAVSAAASSMTAADLVAAYSKKLSGAKCIELYYWNGGSGNMVYGFMRGSSSAAGAAEYSDMRACPAGLSQISSVLSSDKGLKLVCVLPADGVTADVTVEQNIRTTIALNGASVLLSTAVTSDKLVKYSVDTDITATKDWSSFDDGDQTASVSVSIPSGWSRDSKYGPTFTDSQSDIKILEILPAVRLSEGQKLLTDGSGKTVSLEDAEIRYGFGTISAESKEAAVINGTAYNPGGSEDISVWYQTTFWKVDRTSGLAFGMTFYTLSPQSENRVLETLFETIVNGAALSLK